MSANTGEIPRKRWVSQGPIRLCSRLFDGLRDRKVAAEGAESDRKPTAAR
jgi:hypothetical protein